MKKFYYLYHEVAKFAKFLMGDILRETGWDNMGLGSKSPYLILFRLDLHLAASGEDTSSHAQVVDYLHT